MLGDAQLVFRAVDAPLTGWCSSGHRVDPKGLWSREGPGGLMEPIRFFQASGKGLDGIYCEPCLVVANALARENKKCRTTLESSLK
jgi:hypothetical protein